MYSVYQLRVPDVRSFGRVVELNLELVDDRFVAAQSVHHLALQVVGRPRVALSTSARRRVLLLLDVQPSRLNISTSLLLLLLLVQLMMRVCCAACVQRTRRARRRASR